MRNYLKLSILLIPTVIFALLGSEIQYNILYETKNHPELSNKEISEVVNKALNLEGKEDVYFKARVKVYTKENSMIDYYVVYMLQRHFYTAEIYRLQVERDNTITVIEDYMEEPKRGEVDACQTCPDETVEIVVSSFSSKTSDPATEAVKACYEDLIAAGVNVVELYGNEESSSAIKNWLSCENMKLWGRIGHAATNGTIALGSGSIRPSDIRNMDLHHKFMIINSCFIHNQAMIPAMIDDADSYFFCSGDNVSLPLNTSEPVWHDCIKRGVIEGQEFGQALEEAGEDGNMTKYGYTRNPDANGECFWKDVSGLNLGLSSPNGGDMFEPGDKVEITWDCNFEEDIKIELLENSNVAETIESAVPNESPYEWEIPEDVEDGIDYKIRISKADSNEIMDESDSAFTINMPPEFTSDPVTETAELVEYKYEVTADDNGDLSGLEFFAGSDLPSWLELKDNGDGTAELAGTPETGDAGDYEIVIALTDGMINDSVTQSFTLNVGDLLKPEIITEPKDVLITEEGKSATFEVTAEGFALEYQWQKKESNGGEFEDIEGETDSVYVVEDVEESDDGLMFHCVVKNPAGEVESKTALLTVNITAITSLPEPVILVSNGLVATPNPADKNGSIIFSFKAKANFGGRLSIYDPIGNVLDETKIIPGVKSLAWDLRNKYGVKVAGGTYLAVLTISDYNNGEQRIMKTYFGVKE